MPTPIHEFWRWFIEHRADFENLVTTESDFRASALAQLHRLDPHLAFVIPPVTGPRYEFIITAGGKISSFPLAEALIADAPQIAGWKFTALKPPFGFAFTTTFQGTRYEPQAMWFLPIEENGPPPSLSIRVGLPNFTSTTPSQARLAVGIVLETAIGERALAEDIKNFEVVLLPRAPEPAGYIELFELPEIIKEWKAKQH